MNDFSPGALLRLSMSLKQVDPAGRDPGVLRDLRKAATILEALSCLPDPGGVVGDAIAHAGVIKDIVSQRRAEAVIERRIREGLRMAALLVSRRGLPIGHKILDAQALVCQALMQARQTTDMAARGAAYDQAERSLHVLRAATKKPGREAGGQVCEHTRDAARDWAACDARDMAGFDRYMARVLAPVAPPRPAKAARMARA